MSNTYLKELEHYHKLYHDLPAETKELFGTCFKLQDAYDSFGCGGAYLKSMKKVSRLTGIPFEVLDKAFLGTEQRVDYNLEWLRNAGYEVPQFMFDWKEAILRRG